MHLVIDGHDCDWEQLSNAELVRNFLDEFPDRIGMTKITPPAVYTYRGQKEEDWGVSGFVIIAESHISVHTFPDRGYVNIDVFSCKEFDAASAMAEVRQIFAISDVTSWILDRGLEHLDPATAKQVVEAERESVRQRA